MTLLPLAKHYSTLIPGPFPPKRGCTLKGFNHPSLEASHVTVFCRQLNGYHICLSDRPWSDVVCVHIFCAQVGSASAYRETLSRVREVAEAAAAAGTGSSKDERAEVGIKSVIFYCFKDVP